MIALSVLVVSFATVLELDTVSVVVGRGSETALLGDTIWLCGGRVSIGSLVML